MRNELWDRVRGKGRELGIRVPSPSWEAWWLQGPTLAGPPPTPWALHPGPRTLHCEGCTGSHSLSEGVGRGQKARVPVFVVFQLQWPHLRFAVY